MGSLARTKRDGTRFWSLSKELEELKLSLYMFTIVMAPKPLLITPPKRVVDSNNDDEGEN